MENGIVGIPEFYTLSFGPHFFKILKMHTVQDLRQCETPPEAAHPLGSGVATPAR
jgi:hypothetical protein